VQELLAPVLSVMLFEITAALPVDLRICLLQLLPSLAIQPGELVCVCSLQLFGCLSRFAHLYVW
jgi:hypothetical protein